MWHSCDRLETLENPAEQLSVLSDEAWPELREEDHGVGCQDEAVRKQVRCDRGINMRSLQPVQCLIPAVEVRAQFSQRLSVQADGSPPTGHHCEIANTVGSTLVIEIFEASIPSPVAHDVVCELHHRVRNF